MYDRNVTIEVHGMRRDKAVCECGFETAESLDGALVLTPHLRERRGLTGEIDFELVSQSICPARITMRAKSKGAK